MSPRRRAAALTSTLASAALLVAFGASGGEPRKTPPARAADAASDAEPISRIPPDPPALSARKQWVFDLRYESGDVYLVAIHATDMGSPHPTPRVMGRFALELYEGPTLIERARFDFPLLGAGEAPDAGYRGPPRLERKLKTRIGVLFPVTPRGTRLELWDRATDRRYPLPWPPKEGPASPDAGR